MAKRKDASTDIVAVQPDLQVPDFLKGEEAAGVDMLKHFVEPPILKVVQKQSADDLVSMFETGDVIVLPTRSLVAPYEGTDGPTPFLFVPIFFYPEWCTWTPMELRGQVPAIINRSSDRNGEIAMKAANPDARYEEVEYEGRKVEVRHVQHLNFIVTLYNHPLAGEPMIMSFARGEHRSGTRLASLIKTRKAPIYACVFQGQVCKEPRKNNKGSWYGIDVSNPTEDISPWVTAEEYAQLKAQYEEVSQVVAQGRMRVALDDTDVDADDGATPEVDGEF